MQQWDKINPQQYAHGAPHYDYNNQQYYQEPQYQPQYYTNYHTGDYHYNYQRPYEANYGFTPQQQYPYRPIPPPQQYQPVRPPPTVSQMPPPGLPTPQQGQNHVNPAPQPTTYPQPDQNSVQRTHTGSNTRKVPPPPPPPNNRKDCYEDRRDNHDYRRESFSDYRNHPEKRSRWNSDREEHSKGNDSPYYRGDRSKRYHETLSDYDDEDYSDYDQNLSDYQSEYDAESIRSVTSQFQDHSIKNTTKVNESAPNPDDTEIPISEQEKQDYFKRLNLVYATLDDQLTPPEPQKKETVSLARGTVVVKSKPTSLPASRFILKKFEAYQDRAADAIETVQVITKESENKGEAEQVRVQSSTKPKLGFDKNPFNPKWLYNVSDQKWPEKVKPDDDISLLTPDFDPPSDTFTIKKRELHQIQQSTSLSLNASCHVDWILAAAKKIVEEAIKRGSSVTNHLRAVYDLLDGAAYGNEFITDQSIYIHGGITNKFRDEYIQEMVDVTQSETISLLSQPYHASAAFNGQIPKIIKNVKDRENSRALRQLLKQKARSRFPKRRRRNQGRRNGMLSYIDSNYGTRSAKIGNRNSTYGNGRFDNKGRPRRNQNNNNKQNSQWQNSSRNQNNQFPRKPRRNNQSTKQSRHNGNRNRDYN